MRRKTFQRAILPATVVSYGKKVVVFTSQEGKGDNKYFCQDKKRDIVSGTDIKI